MSNIDEAVKCFNLGNDYYTNGKLDLAIENYTKAIELNPKYSPAYHNIGLIYDSRGEYILAIRDYNKAIELDPNNAYAYHNRGIAQNNDFAERDFAKAKEIAGV